MSAVPAGSSISSSRLHLFVREARALGFSGTVHAHPLSRAWEEPAVTWRRRMGAENWTAPGGDYGASVASLPFAALGAGAWLTFDIPAAVVQAWVNDPSANFGLLLKPAANNGPGAGTTQYNFAVFASSEDPDATRRPKLEITYAAAGNVGPLVSVSAPADEALVTPGRELRLAADASDPDGSVARVDFYAGDVCLGSDSVEPFEYTWAGVPRGLHALSVRAWDSGGRVATSAWVSVRAAQLIYEANMDSNPGWTLSGSWAYGQPAGVDNGYGYADPAAGFTGAKVVGFNLGGPYGRLTAAQYAVTPAINCRDFTNVWLDFRFWLGVEGSTWDRASVEVSTNGSSWSNVWVNPAEPLAGGSWARMQLNLSPFADGRPTVYVRWGMGPTDSSYHYCGWNIDDVRLTGDGEDGGGGCRLTVRSAHGGSQPPDGTHSCAYGTALECQVTNSPVYAGELATQYVCVGAVVLGNTYTAIAPTRVSLVLTNDAALTWEWRTNFWLAARAGPRGTIAGGNQWYGRAEMGVVEARPAEYCRFVRWTGTVTSAANPLRIPMLRPHRVVADFAAERTPQGTPHWWLAAFGLTNLDWETEAMRDADGDGLLNWQEHAASSDPRDGQSRFAIAEAGCAQGTNYLRWPSAGVDEELPPFRVEVSTNLLRIGGWSPGVPPTVARPRGGGTNVWLENSALPAPNRFYRIMATNAP